jgi:hypothetical protein
VFHATYVTYSEVTGVTPTEMDIRSLLQPLAVGTAIFFLSRINMHLRLASNDEERTFEQAIGEAQAFLFSSFTDEQLHGQIKQVLGRTKTHERVLFHPFQILNMMRYSLIYCEGSSEMETVTDDHRYAIGRCCLMMNDLLMTEDARLGLFTASGLGTKAALMAHFLPEFEVANPGTPRNLVNRSLSTFNLLLSDRQTRTEILSRSGGYDFVQRFNDLVGLNLEQWVTILFSCIAYFHQYGNKEDLEQRNKYLWIHPKAFTSASKISDDGLTIVLTLISKSIAELAGMIASPVIKKHSMRVITFKFYPLTKIGDIYVCNDLGFLVEKLVAGAYWTLHDREVRGGRERLASAWGILFERYINWWIQGRRFQRDMLFYPFPVWDSGVVKKRRGQKGPDVEAFDGAILQNRRFVALEYKGGFLKLEAKYSMNLRALIRDLNKKIGKGCQQLAQGISDLFGATARHQLRDVPTNHVTRVIPVIVVQDQALRSWGVDWWVNRQFQRMMRRSVLRSGITVEPVTLIHVQEFETMIDSAEGPDFDLIGTLQLRNFRDPDRTTDLQQLLMTQRGYGTQHSTRRGELEDELKRCVEKYVYDLPVAT